MGHTNQVVVCDKFCILYVSNIHNYTKVEKQTNAQANSSRNAKQITNKHKQTKTTDVAPLRLWSRIQSALALKTKRKHKDKHDKLILFEGSEAFV